MHLRTNLLALFAAALLFAGCVQTDTAQTEATQTEAAAPRFEAPILVIHGGAGTILPENMTPEREEQLRASLTNALEAGYDVLEGGGSSLDAIVEAITLMEDDSLFNAGLGAVMTAEGTHELDASIMDGSTRGSGAVAGVTSIKNPILLARHVMEDSPHVMMAGEGAEAFADGFDLERVSNDYFTTLSRSRALERAQAREEAQSFLTPPAPEDASQQQDALRSRVGTVGAVALDVNGNLAAGTSTGGMTNKRFGRVGDAPIIGAGTYADDRSAAISATGHGEYFIRAVVAHDIAARVLHTGQNVAEAAEDVVMRELMDFGGSGGVIALGADGTVAMPFNTPGMYRGFIAADTVYVGMFEE
jgi:beta-aspartyl-peptidase (threonine type)